MFEQGFILAILLCIITCLLTTRVKPSWIFASAAVVVFMAGLIEFKDLAVNFTNTSLVTLTLLILSSCALEKTRLISWVCRSVTKGSLGVVVARLGLSTALLSSFTNNTAVVVALMGAIKRNRQHAPSKLLIPLSYAAIFGGTLTLIGTSTNLIINSFVEELGLPSLDFFAPTIIGVIVLFGGLAILIPISYLLPNYDDDHTDDLPYFLEAKVMNDSTLVGKSIEENGLRDLRKLLLAEIIRDGRSIRTLSPDFLIQENDRLMFCGDIESIATLQEIEGVTLFGQHYLNGQSLIEVVLSSSSSICRSTLKTSRFRDRFGAVVVAIRRGHEHLQGGLGNIRLMAGDILVLVPSRRFEANKEINSREFIQATDLDSSAKLDNKKSSIVVIGFVSAIGLSLIGAISIIKGLLIYLIAMLLMRVIRIGELRRRFPMDIVVIVGAALSIAQLMISTGLSDKIGLIFLDMFSAWGVYGALVGIYLITLVLTELVTNNAAAALAFPLGYSVAMSYGVDPMPFIMAVLFGASASFISPYGYQTNLLVFSVGNYSMKDFVKVGTPVSIVYSILVLISIPIFFPF
ncbi:SLC13 family permease [Vibrio sp.]|nr:SLC13 family permease [Vibrio sp.]